MYRIEHAHMPRYQRSSLTKVTGRSRFYMYMSMYMSMCHPLRVGGHVGGQQMPVM